MSPILKFLASARSLASQGFKKEQIYEFAQREFGEINELMQKQIENIFKPQKPTISRNKPLDPDDVLPNYNETPGEFARRETPGSKENLLQELKIAYEKEFNRLRGDETAEELKEMLKNLDTDGVPFASGGRAGYYGGGQAMVGEDLSEIGHGSDALMARNMQIAPGGQATTSTGLNYLLGQDNDTVRVPYSKGKIAKKVVNEGRRGFMKAAGAGAAGIAALKTGLLGFGEKVAPVAKEAVEAATGAAQSVPPYFWKLVEKIKNLGDDAPKLATQDRQKVTTYKDFEMTEDVSTGEIEIFKNSQSDEAIERFGGENATEEVFMRYKPSEKILLDEANPGGGVRKTLPEYEANTSYTSNNRGNTGEILDEVDGVPDDIKLDAEMESELFKTGKADGGRIGYGKGKIVKEGIPALINKVKSLFGDDAITTADKIPTPQKTLDRNMFKAADTRLNDKRMMNVDELEDFEMDIGADQLEGYNFNGTVGDAKRILKEDKAYEAEMYQQYKMGKLDPVAGDKSPARKRFLEQKLEEMEASGDPQLMTRDEIEELTFFDLGTEMDKTKLSINDEIKAGVDDVMRDTSPEGLAKSIEIDNLMLEYPGMTKDLADQIASSSPTMKADMIAMVEQTFKMDKMGMSGDEIIDTFKNTKRTKQASGGLAAMLGE
jgi:hypothetical protein